MLTSLALIFLIGLAMAKISSSLKIPKIIGMLITGLILGPFSLNLLEKNILAISQDLRQIALIIILLKAGLSLNLKDLKKVGRPAILMSFLPASFEILAFYLLAPIFFSISKTDALLMGAVLSAVSPAVVIPRMVHLIENSYGKNKAIPEMIMAGASCDDVFVIALFTSFLSLAQGQKAFLFNLLSLPLSIISGICLGLLSGLLLANFFEKAYQSKKHIRNTSKVIILLAVSFLLIAIEKRFKSYLPISGLLAIISMAAMIKIKASEKVSKRLSEKFGKLWIGAEVILFVLVGAAVDIGYTLKAGWLALVLIILALIFRSIAVYLCLLKTNLNKKEKTFCLISYLPKATVQAAIGSVPLSLGIGSGKLILSVAVLAILLTAPLGAFGMDMTYKKFLEKNEEKL